MALLHFINLHLNGFFLRNSNCKTGCSKKKRSKKRLCEMKKYGEKLINQRT